MRELIKEILLEYVMEQRVPRGYWTPETLKQEAEKYNTEGEFIQNSSSAYQTARRMGVLDFVLQNLQRTDRKKYTKDEVAKEALKYTNRNAFKKGSASYYRAAIAHKWIEDVTKHMLPSYKTWNKEDVEKEALKYNYPSEFGYNSPKAYGAAVYHGWLQDVTSHMGKLGSIKKRMVYAYEFSDNYVYVGLTYHKDKRNDQHMKSGPVYRHIKETGLTPIRIEVSDYIDAQDASKLEQDTEQKYRNNGWNILNQAKPGVLGGSLVIWTPKTVRDEANKYDTISQFRNGNPKAYNAAKRNGWIPELGLENTDVRWDLESVQKEANKYKTRREFATTNTGAYQFAVRNKILDDVTKHMDLQKIKWTKELASQEALNYKTKNDFYKGNRRAHDAAIKYGWIDDITKHMISNISTHTKDEIKKVADQYTNYTEFVKAHSNLAQYAKKKKWDDLFSHMKKKKEWDYNSVKKEAEKYSSKKEFNQKSKGAYLFAYRNGFLDDITNDYPKQRTIWTKDLIYSEAKKYNSRYDFEKGNASAYLAARRNGFLDDLFPNPKSKGINQWTKR